MLGNSHSAKDERVQSSMTAMLLVISTYSFVVSFPAFVSRVTDLAVSRTESLTYLRYWAPQIILPFNYCDNFFFYVLSGKRLVFLCHLLKLLLFWRKDLNVITLII